MAGQGAPARDASARTDPPAPGRKRPYTRPSLVTFGTVAKLTQTGFGSGLDGGGGTMEMMCL
jgi:hypothetical protein